MSAFDRDLGPVEVKMRQIIQEQDKKRTKRRRSRPDKKGLAKLAVSFNVRTEGSLKPKNKRSNPLKNIISGSSKSIAPDSQDEDEVYIFYFLFFIFSYAHV